MFAKKRDQLLKYCHSKGIEAKVHYPIPIYRQAALKYLGYKKGDFPVTESISNSQISIPIFPEMKKNEIDYVIKIINNF